MKFRRFLSGLLFGLGCALSFVAFLAIVLPGIDNPQLQLVVASFQMTSAHPAVQAINAFMTFAFQQNWRLLGLGLLILAVGCGLLVHFSPVRKTKTKPSNDVLPPAPPPASEEHNPFAHVSYPDMDPEPLAVQSPIAFHPEPILEPNAIEERQDSFLYDVQPYFSPRLTAESRAIEADAGLPSQSGSRILVRSICDPIPAQTPVLPADPAPSEEPEASPVSKTVPLFSTAEPKPIEHPNLPPLAPSGRIRSTMGRHHSTNANLNRSRS